jgi:hypothetical protein
VFDTGRLCTDVSGWSVNLPTQTCKSSTYRSTLDIQVQGDTTANRFTVLCGIISRRRVVECRILFDAFAHNAAKGVGGASGRTNSLAILMVPDISGFPARSGSGKLNERGENNVKDLLIPSRSVRFQNLLRVIVGRHADRMLSITKSFVVIFAITHTKAIKFRLVLIHPQPYYQHDTSVNTHSLLLVMQKDHLP